MAKRLIFTEVTDKLDRSTGEITHTETTRTHVIKQNEDHFIMIFLDNIDLLGRITHPSDWRLFIEMMKICGYNNGIISLSTADREIICKKIDVDNSNLSKNIRRLKELDLISGERGRYELNPLLLWKGDRKERRTNLNSKKMPQSQSFN